MRARAGRPRQARRALESARHAPPSTALLRRRLVEALADCSDEERDVLALLVGERLTTAEAAMALEVSPMRVLSVRTALFDSLRRALSGVSVPRRESAPRLAEDTPLRRAS